MKIKMFYKRFIGTVRTYSKLPHLKILGIIVLLAVLSLNVSIYSKDEYISSLFANIFAGLVTGIVISVISSVKAFSLYRTEVLINWLEKLHQDYLEYNAISRRLLSCKTDDFATVKELEDYIYDVLCRANDIPVTISQGRFNQSLPFNSYKYFKKHLKYDAEEQIQKNKKMREEICAIDGGKISRKELKALFKDMNDTLASLNKSIVRKIDELRIQQKATNTF